MHETDATIITSFAGDGAIDVAAFDGALTLVGEVSYSFDITLHIIFAKLIG